MQQRPTDSKKARTLRNPLRRKLHNSRKINTRTKTLLRNALIRSTLTYALQPHEIAIHGQQRIDSFTFARIRQIVNIHWYKEHHKPQRRRKHTTLAQPATTSWINKLRIAHMLQQTRNGWNAQETPLHYGKSTENT